MRGTRRIAAIATLASLAALIAPVAGLASYDDLNGETLGDTPYTSAAIFSRTIDFDSSGFTTDPTERDQKGRLLSCSDPTPEFAGDGSYGARTAWVRFATGVAGEVRLSAISAMDIFWEVWTAPQVNAGFAEITDIDCFNEREGTGGEEYAFGYPIPANRVVYVQVLVVCKDDVTGLQPYCTDGEVAAKPGGPTSLTFRFFPNDGDHDGQPDTLDRCPQAGTIAGCPDTDEDGKADIDEAAGCVGIKGTGADGCRNGDEDGDRYRTDAATPALRDCDDDNPNVNPGMPEIKNNDVDENCDGKKAFDKDLDNVIDAPVGPDCNPDDPRIPRKEVPGNKVDEDCVGGPAPFPKLGSNVLPATVWLPSQRPFGLFVKSLKIKNVARGMSIEVKCNGRCGGFTIAKFRVKKKAALFELAGPLALRKLLPGATLVVRVALSGHFGKAFRWTIPKVARAPKREDFCLRPNSPTLLKRCS
jgi:Putative metal-binding motif